MNKEIYESEPLWDDLIAIGRDTGLSDDDIVERLMIIENSYVSSNRKTPDIYMEFLNREKDKK